MEHPSKEKVVSVCNVQFASGSAVDRVRATGTIRTKTAKILISAKRLEARI
jgi:hypothetical protein